ncbi:hypothetical protein PLEOSDRAFT_159295 [Pleurotus ostreatus PC15]|uniref:MSP domain-containing protein n=1 Tax=Pleurotus ostreatus (strain PC15) TaxID=1137138 RepID=A0A067NRS0_PLEO1|nr:hypothetical protein PLEOSDRAFT_159295 [Pleurotus ostreatus PC15]
MSVTLHPTDVLTFQRPFNEVITQRLILTNRNAEPIAFKVKTSAPLKYLVRPNKGRAEPGESLEISIFLQPMRTEPPPDYICPDKFLIQSTFITADREKLSLTDIWNAPVMSMIHEIHGQKLRVTLAVDPCFARSEGTSSPGLRPGSFGAHFGRNQSDG